MVKNKKSDEINIGDSISLWGIAGEIGYKLAIPLLIFLLGGIYFDKKLGTSPLFALLGIILALGSSVYLIYDMIRKVNRFKDKE